MYSFLEDSPPGSEKENQAEWRRRIARHVCGPSPKPEAPIFLVPPPGEEQAGGSGQVPIAIGICSTFHSRLIGRKVEKIKAKY
ncbi:hypothetical protein SAMN04487894_102356 [Niabella drilacis]|uniref:Uncharacterized protein n=1 Tax=Niabella drilacis (strain DSM 25811 / CCM 8410 / CCUG 62505 / LMG 26954 / E90) TaxID=1285928 RepID=A0A1G6LIU2_NIADE|nr:hypothetical protein SAMN04487894_102356 [Niabella drilacis]